LDVVAAFFNLMALEVLQPELKEKLARLRKEQEQGLVAAELEEAAADGETVASEGQAWHNFLAHEALEIRKCIKNFC
ncbi:MAG: hypothetical protein ACUVTG_14290, partial [Candidatus Oleimicrobiaceae bacterium]